MGEKQNQPFQLLFNTSLKVDFQASRVTSDGGLILVRELDERLGLEKLMEEHLSDSRQGLNKQFTLADLLRQSVYTRLAGYEDLNDAERLAADPTFRLINSQRIWHRGAVLTSTLHWFETELLAKEENLIGLMALNRETLGQAESLASSDHVVLDMDSSESSVHGEQEGSATTDTSSRSATTRCFCSIVTGTAWRRSCVRATYTAPRTGTKCCCRKSSVNRQRASKLLSGRTRPLPNRRSTKFQPTIAWSGTLRNC